VNVATKEDIARVLRALAEDVERRAETARKNENFDVSEALIAITGALRQAASDITGRCENCGGLGHMRTDDDTKFICQSCFGTGRILSRKELIIELKELLPKNKKWESWIDSTLTLTEKRKLWLIKRAVDELEATQNVGA